MKENSFLVIDKSALPEVYEKVVYATSLLESGEAESTTQAVKLAGISRSVYYKYKDSVFPYSSKGSGGIVTMQLVLQDKPGVLMELLSVFYEAEANILSVNQNIPVKGRAFVTISAKGTESLDADELIAQLKNVNGVIKIESIIG